MVILADIFCSSSGNLITIYQSIPAVNIPPLGSTPGQFLRRQNSHSPRLKKAANHGAQGKKSCAKNPKATPSPGANQERQVLGETVLITQIFDNT